MKRGISASRAGSLLVAVLLLSSSVSVHSVKASGSSQSGLSQNEPSATSWALGFVVPEGASLEGGGSAHWESVDNVTALVRLPEITRPDLPVYAVLSLMADDGTVLQVAAGVYLHSSTWRAYADIVSGAESASPSYYQVLNSSGPRMSPNASVVISIFRPPSGPWSLEVLDRNTGMYVEREFPLTISPALRAGDQEVFALESYSVNQTTFQRMGNLTLGALFIDGKVAAGGYAYSDWNPTYNPVFVVGSPGSSPPLFISLTFDGSEAVWYFVNQSVMKSLGYPSPSETVLLLLMMSGPLVAVSLIFGLSAFLDRRRAVRSRGSGTSVGQR